MPGLPTPTALFETLNGLVAAPWESVSEPKTVGDGEIVALIGVYSFFRMNQVIVAYHVRAEGTITLGEELADYKRIVPEKLRPWPMGTGQAVSDWLAARQQGTP